ncbi:MAG: GNAT family N-acetyltransferase [Bacteroidales bacterium]|nr:GNAT family N-acetyltransferase [Bacteroidales bacterium]
MKNIIPPVSRSLIEAELNTDRFVRMTNNGNNEIYIVSWHNSPNTLLEIGRLREISFRDAGGGTGDEYDLDDYDKCYNCFDQLLVWDPVEKEIIGGYRYIHGRDQKIDKEGNLIGPTGKLFKFSEHFLKNYLPFCIELGRSFVQPKYQPMYNIRKGMYSLDNIWDGLGALIVDNPDIQYLFGKITMYPHYNRQARDMILYFLHRYFPDKEKFAWPFHPLKAETEDSVFEELFTGNTYEENYRILVQEVRKRKENIPPLVNAYMNLSSTMRTFGTAVNYGFGDVEETGIMVTIGDIYNMKKSRHLDSYKNENV